MIAYLFAVAGDRAGCGWIAEPGLPLQILFRRRLRKRFSSALRSLIQRPTSV